MAKPQIRLKGFEGEWENVCFKDFSYPAGEKNRDNLPFESYSISNEFGFVPQNEQFEKGGTMANADKRMYYIVKPDSFAYNPARINVGSIGYDNLDKDVIVSSLYVIFKTDSETNNEWLNIWFKTPYFKRLVELYQEGGVRLYFFYDKLCACHLNRPLLLEQKAIADYFKSLDFMLQSTTKKIESLKQMKSACLVSMFPQADETTPRVRFKGFEGEWDRKPLSDCLEISNEKNFDDKYGKESVLSVSDDFGVMNQIELLGRSYAGKSVNNYGILRHGELVYTKSPLKSKPYGIVKENTGETGIVSVLYAIYRAKEGCWIPYFHYYFDPAWRLNAYLRPLINKGAKNTMNISDETALTGYIMVPKDIKEQQCIASYFRSLDKQISLQEQRLEKLKQIKAACLDKMFV